MKVAVEKASARLRAGEGTKIARRNTIERELRWIEAKQGHLVDAIAVRGKYPNILDRLRGSGERLLQASEASRKIAPPSLDLLRAHYSKHCG